MALADLFSDWSWMTGGWDVPFLIEAPATFDLSDLGGVVDLSQFEVIPWDPPETFDLSDLGGVTDLFDDLSDDEWMRGGWDVVEPEKGWWNVSGRTPLTNLGGLTRLLGGGAAGGVGAGEFTIPVTNFMESPSIPSVPSLRVPEISGTIPRAPSPPPIPFTPISTGGGGSAERDLTRLFPDMRTEDLFPESRTLRDRLLFHRLYGGG